jgi:hypothetical protein
VPVPAKPHAADDGREKRGPTIQPETHEFTPFGKRPFETGPPTLTRAATAELEREIEERYCGTAGDVNLSDAREWAKLTYDPARHFQGVLAKAIATTRDSGIPQEILGLPAPLCVLPGPRITVKTTLKPGVLRSLCVIALLPSMRIAPSPAPAFAADVKPASAAAMLWEVALWTSRGRLCRGIDPTTRLRLGQWPNFTRVAQTPHAMRIAALLSDDHYSALELCASLRIPQRYVFSFIAAAATMPQLEIMPPAAARIAGPAATKAVHAPPPRSLLARILGRLVASV